MPDRVRSTHTLLAVQFVDDHILTAEWAVQDLKAEKINRALRNLVRGQAVKGAVLMDRHGVKVLSLADVEEMTS